MERCVVGNWLRRVLPELDFVWQRGESWLIDGANGSGKSALVALWMGRLDAVDGKFVRDVEWARAEEAWIGFERQRLLLEWERHIDMTDVMDGPDPGTLLETFVADVAVLAQFGLEGKGSRGLKQLSTGELRRACLARAWVLGLPFLVLDEPFEGLDVSGVALVSSLLSRALEKGCDLAFLTRRPGDAPQWQWKAFSLGGSAQAPQLTAKLEFEGEPHGSGEPVLEFVDVHAGYPGVPVLRSFHWKVRRGDRWLVSGPNGSGKSTLMALISGDHPQVFSNDIKLFGLRRGPELTLAQLRQRVGVVSYSSHLAFRNLFGVKGLEVVASGYQGTVGLWAEPTWDQIQACRGLVAEWGLAEASDRVWDELSWGTQRLLLLARALVCNPEILLLDEPCQGLDTVGRDHVLQRLASWTKDKSRTLLYVTHRPDEVPSSAFQSLVLPWQR